MKKIDKLNVKYHDRLVGILTMTIDNQQCAFQYDKEWLLSGFSISPLELPLRDEIFIAKPYPFNGNFGIFEDSLPDGYGRYLLKKSLLKEGIEDSDLSALDRLSIVGNGGMGALTYAPATEIIQGSPSDNLDILQQKALEVLKERQSEDAELLLYNSGNSGGARPKAVFVDDEGHWLVKFRHLYDQKDIGIQEYAYNQLASECGIEVQDFKLINEKYFASKRFDLSTTGERIHTATAGGLLGISLRNPILDYTNLLALTGFLTQSEKQVEEMYRRMIFNYLMDNKDDHCKNFSFLVVFDEEEKNWKWNLAPAYDLTLSTEGYNGEHATSVNGTGSPTFSDFLAVGKKIKLSEVRCRQLIDQIYDICGNHIRHRF